MAIGRYRDVPDRMDDAECAVAAAQYPEGGLVVGMGLGIGLALLFAPALVAVGPLVGSVAGFAAGRWVARRRLRQLRATR
ncbi:hypothetical protein [Halomarina ordinaria]|uniref:Uncharacterized protein n=1 Tax=Halomarina ordinaria TaxID=3033939 RepID=A0ABD5UE62_9EURY|nr:hypothetical protein [Halomarina sp. PSRA2]